MTGYTPYMAGAVAAAKKASAAAQARHRAENREDYNLYRAEARACGYEFASFEEWMGETSSKAAAYSRLSFLTFNNMDLY